MSECRSAYIAEQCGCHTHHLPRIKDDIEECDFNQTISCVDPLTANGFYNESDCNCVDYCHQNIYGVKLSYADITTRILLHINIMSLQSEATQRLEFKQRLLADEFEQTAELLNELETTTLYLQSQLWELMDTSTASNLLGKLLCVGGLLQNVVQSTIQLGELQQYSNAYNAVANPIIQRSISTIETAITELHSLRFDILVGQPNNTLFIKREHVAALLENAKEEIQKYSGAKLFSSILVIPDSLLKYLSAKPWYSEDCTRLSYVYRMEDIINVLDHLHGFVSQEATADSQQTLNLSRVDSLMIELTTSLSRFVKCLDEYGSHLREGLLLLAKIKDMKTEMTIRKLDESLTDNLQNFLDKIQAERDKYYEHNTTKSAMLQNIFSADAKHKMANITQGTCCFSQCFLSQYLYLFIYLFPFICCLFLFHILHP